MSLSAGTKLGPYEILTLIGAGGMGKVYRARDPRMGRDVAIKISAERFGDRFSREVHAVAALSHPNICHLYDVGSDYLVMELVEGPTLAERIRQGAVPLDEAQRIARQIADALEAAHEKGIIHRDLKPGNIILRPDGAVKVLDFGLAKVTETASGERLEDSQSPTLEPVSRVGVVVGTAAYMPPEQARGKLVDKRADIWAFGVILYEMLTGERPFGGETVTDTLIEVATKEPDWEQIPARARRLLRSCLEKDPQRRLRDIGDAWFWLEDAPLEVADTPKKGGRWKLPVALAAIAALIGVAFAVGHYTRRPPGARTLRFSFAPPFKSPSLNLTVSPDGTHIAFTGIYGGMGLWLSSIDSSTIEKLPVPEEAASLFWSPDGRSLGFISSDGRLQRLSIDNTQTPPQTVTSSANPFAGAAWSAAGVILFQPEQTGSGLLRVPAGGGAPAPATHLNPARQEIVHRYPQFLPDGRHFIYWVWSALAENTGEYIGSLDPKEKPEGQLVRTWREAHYADPGYLLYLEGTTLMARPFDPSGLRFSGEPHALPERIGRHWGTTGRAVFSTSATGDLIYQEALPPPRSRIVLRGRDGKVMRTLEAPAASQWPSFDPQGTHVAIQGNDENTVEELWTIDLERGFSYRLNAAHGSNQRPVWSPDGRRIAFMSNRAGAYDLYAMNADGTGDEELLVKSPHTKTPVGWSMDGRFLVYCEIGTDNKSDLWVLPLKEDRKPILYLKTAFGEFSGSLSPVPDKQGHLWMAYHSDETGSAEVYLRPFLPGAPGGPAGAAVRVSADSGNWPQWRKDGRELFYQAQGLMAVDVKLGDTLEIGAPHKLLDQVGDLTVSGDGQRFLFVENAGEASAAKINVVLNWTAELAGK